MTEGSVERTLGRVEGELKGLASAVKQIAEDSASDHREVLARVSAIETRLSSTEVGLADIRMDLAKIAPVADEFVGLRKRATWSVAFIIGLMSLASFIGLDRLVTWLGSFR